MTLEQVTDLRIYSGKKNDLSPLPDCPNVIWLFLQGTSPAEPPVSLPLRAGGLRRPPKPLCLKAL